jgi:demethylmenaquinone methyltransferase/2-methoxy-6-polyprenyl-1,4-benzoquinol methylase
MDESGSEREVIEAYRRRAPRYDLAVRRFDLFARFGFDLPAWREQAIEALHLKPGATVVDIGCGTGLNFPYLYRAVTPSGTIVGVDLSEDMLAQARQTVAAQGWTNVQLLCADATQYEPPSHVDAVLSTFALTLVPEPARVISNARRALSPQGRIAILDMAWPGYVPLWWRHVLFFLRSYGVTPEVLRRRPWDVVQTSIAASFEDVSVERFW